MSTFYVTQASSMEGKPNYFYSPPESKTANTVINAAIKAAGAVATATNPSTVFIEKGTYVISDHIWFTPNGNPKRASTTQVAPAYPCNNVILQGVNKPKIKIAAGLDGSKWGGSSTYDRLGMIFMYGAKNITLSNILLDGSYDDLYAGKANFTYGQSKMDAVVLYACDNIKADLITVINGACDAFLVAKSSRFTATECIIDHCGHDGFQCYSSTDVLVDRCRVGIRSNCGFRWAGSSARGEVRNSEFWTALGGASAFELQNAASSLKIHHNYIHDVNGNGKYGGIGYPGQSPTGSGHEYYNNIIVDCVFGISDNIPSTAVIRKNVVLNCSLTSKGTQSGNVTSVSGYTFQKFGTKKSGDTYWKVTGGALIEELVGIIPKVTPEPPATEPVLYRKYSDPDGKSHVIVFPNLSAENLKKVVDVIESVRV